MVNLFRHHFKIPLIYVDAEDHFLKKLKGVIDPEEKRKRIGKEFISIFEREAKKIGGVEYLSPGDALSRCDRKRFIERALRNDQEPSQCGRIARKDEIEISGTPPRIV